MNPKYPINAITLYGTKVSVIDRPEPQFQLPPEMVWAYIPDSELTLQILRSDLMSVDAWNAQQKANADARKDAPNTPTK